jgi:hypothetical protein
MLMRRALPAVLTGANFRIASVLLIGAAISASHSSFDSTTSGSAGIREPNRPSDPGLLSIPIRWAAFLLPESQAWNLASSEEAVGAGGFNSHRFTPHKFPDEPNN